jgi:hypothetical protein
MNEKVDSGLDGIQSTYDAPTIGYGFITGPNFGCIHHEYL